MAQYMTFALSSQVATSDGLNPPKRPCCCGRTGSQISLSKKPRSSHLSLKAEYWAAAFGRNQPFAWLYTQWLVMTQSRQLQTVPRKLAFHLITLAAVGCSSAEPHYFEGTVTRTVTTESKYDQLPADPIDSWFGHTELWTYKGGDYRVDFEGGDLVSLWYVQSENREYWLRTCDDYVGFHDAGTSYMSDASIVIPDATMQIAGFSARAIELHVSRESGWISVWRYWYAPDLPVNPGWFSEFRVGGLHKVYEHIDSLIIGFELELPHWAKRTFASEIDRRSVADSELTMPELQRRRLTMEEIVDITPCPVD